MREVFQQELREVQDGLVEIATLVARGDREGDARLQRVERQPGRGGHRRRPLIDQRAQALDELAITILARQQPVARDLRIVVSALRISASSSAWATSPRTSRSSPATGSPTRSCPSRCARPSWRWARWTSRSRAGLVELLRTEDVELAEEIRNEDDKVDALHLSVFEKVLGETWKGEAGGHGRRDAGEPLPRAIRRPRGVDRQEGAVPRDGRLGARDGLAAETTRPSGCDIRSAVPFVGGGYFLPCAATAAAPAAAASGSRYSPGLVGMKSSPSS